MSIRRINSGIQPNCKDDIFELGENFPSGFQYFFMPSVIMLDHKKEVSCYVSDKDEESKIAKILHGKESNFSIFIGERGTGKTAIIKHCFNMFSNQIQIEKDILYSTQFFKGYYSSIENSFSIEKRILSINSRLEKEFPKLYEYFQSKIGYEHFCDFIENSELDVLQQKEIKNLEFQNMEENNGVDSINIYETMKLHFLLSSYFCPINRLVICIDDIEELSIQQREKVVCSYVALYKRLTSFMYTKNFKKYTIVLLISLSPDSYRTLYTKKEKEFWPISNRINRKNLFNLERYFSKRLQIYSQKQNSQNLDAWRRCQQQFTHICQRFGGKYDMMIKNLTFNNIGESLKLYAKILCNQKWVKQGERASTSEWFNPETYILNNISVIRAIACGENEIFVNDSEGYISNLLYNTNEKDYSILCLYIVSFFVRHNATSDECGAVYYTVRDIIYTFKDIFATTSNIETDVYKSICYLYCHKILKRSYKDMTESENSRMELIESSKLYLSSKGKELWNMFQSDSVLMEMCREDYYREYDSEGCFNNKYSSFVLMQSQQQNELFIDLCRMLQQLIDVEKKYILDARNNRTEDLVTEFFGERMMCSYLIEGIKNSMDYSGLIRQRDVSDAYSRVMDYMTKSL